MLMNNHVTMINQIISKEYKWNGRYLFNEKKDTLLFM